QPKDRRSLSRVRRTAGLLLADVSVIALIVINVAGATPEVTDVLAQRLGMSVRVARLTLLAGAVIAVLPFLYGAVRLARALGPALAAPALPAPGRGRHPAPGPRR